MISRVIVISAAAAAAVRTLTVCKRNRQQLFVKSDDSKYRSWYALEGSSNVVVQGAAESLLEDCVEKGLHRGIHDFDDHMSDISKDWLNATLLG